MQHVADSYFRDALHQLTGVKPPVSFRFRPTNESLADLQQEWCVNHVRSVWACGISLLEAAERFVVDAWDNGNILTPWLDHRTAMGVTVRRLNLRK